jgi:SAM-dependent methyltransferase
MTEDRRAVPIPKPLDSDAAPTLPDLDSPNSSKPGAAASSLTDEAEAPTLRPPSDPPVGARKRSRMALRIPDDEVARPQPLIGLDRPRGDTSLAEPSSVDRVGGAGEVMPGPNHSVPGAVEVPARPEHPAPGVGKAPSGIDHSVARPADVLSGVDHARPGVNDLPSGFDPARIWARNGPSPVSSPGDSTIVPGRIITINPAALTPAVQDASVHVQPDTPSDEEDVQLEADALPLVTPRIVPAPTPATPAAQSGAQPAARPVTQPPASQEREARPDAGEGEISADDLVPIDATPAPPELAVGLPPVRRRLPSQPPVPPPTSRKAGATPPAPRPSKPPLVIVPPHMGSVAPQTPEGSGLRRKGRFWWEELFNDDYLRAAERMTDEQLVREVDFIEQSLAIERGGAMLDLACGTGRHAVELARRGYQVVGFDLSLAMLARASDEAQERRTKLNFVQGDMREMTFAEQFDGVYCWNTSFGYFEEEKNALVVDRIRSALKGGGLLLLDVVNRDFLVQQSPSLVWFEGDGCVCMDEMVVDFITSRMRVKRTMMLDDGRSREIEYSMRIYSLHELGKMLHDHGFKVCEVSGRTATPGVFLGHESPRTIILAEKR